MAAPIVLDATAKVTSPATVIWLHGLGDSGEGWADGCEMFQSKLPHIKFILPTAPVAPVTLNRGMKMTSWHDIVSLQSIDSSAFTGLDASRGIVQGLIDAEIKSGTASERIMLGGFSQGGAMTLYTGLQCKTKLAGLVVLSGYLPYSGTDFGDKIKAAGNATTSVLVCHGSADPVVNPKAGAKAVDTLKAANVPVTSNVYPGMGHSSCPQEMAAVLKFIGTQLPATAATATAAAATATATAPAAAPAAADSSSAAAAAKK